MSDKPGRELPKDVRAIALDLVDNQDWTYVIGKTHCKLFPPDKSKGFVTVSKSASDHRSYRNMIAQIRRAGGIV